METDARDDACAVFRSVRGRETRAGRPLLATYVADDGDASRRVACVGATVIAMRSMVYDVRT